MCSRTHRIVRGGGWPGKMRGFGPKKKKRKREKERVRAGQAVRQRKVTGRQGQNAEEVSRTRSQKAF